MLAPNIVHSVTLYRRLSFYFLRNIVDSRLQFREQLSGSGPLHHVAHIEITSLRIRPSQSKTKVFILFRAGMSNSWPAKPLSFSLYLIQFMFHVENTFCTSTIVLTMATMFPGWEFFFLNIYHCFRLLIFTLFSDRNSVIK